MRKSDEIPEFLKPYICEQDASLYTPIDHASWRYIMRVSRDYFKDHAHEKYLDGLTETGISTERIPLISEIDQKLRAFGWRAIGVSGFIPPGVFMEFQALGILPIACDMRKLENLAYTPAPDIVHEAAGHAPIIADLDYAEYLKNYGEIAYKAIYSFQDVDLYLATRKLADLKEDPDTSTHEIHQAEKQLKNAIAAITEPSEATQLARMNWWSVEYGLIGSLENPKIYGAGLLSSVWESFSCLGPTVKKIPFDMKCVYQNYDITKPQPQLFVTPDFKTLTKTLELFKKDMSYTRGGSYGLKKALDAQTVTTTVLDSGLEISGIIREYQLDPKNQHPVFLAYNGPCQLSYQSRQLPGHGGSLHQHGFSSPTGKLLGFHKSSDQMTDADWKKSNTFEFESGFILKGTFVKSIRNQDRCLVASFDNCTIEQNGKNYYQPSWGTFDLACGSKVVSVFGGASDRAAFIKDGVPINIPPQKPKTNLRAQNKNLNVLYQNVRSLRENNKTSPQDLKSTLSKIYQELDRSYPDDWLLRLEIRELVKGFKINDPDPSQIENDLNRIAAQSHVLKSLIERGLKVS